VAETGLLALAPLVSFKFEIFFPNETGFARGSALTAK
jgi:hypothetical protein